LATAIMSMGTDGIETLKDKIPDLKYFIIYSDSVGNYKTEYSKEMEKFLSFEAEKKDASPVVPASRTVPKMPEQ
jgi:hypothetical protein